jgi:hypothetical protein
MRFALPAATRLRRAPLSAVAGVGGGRAVARCQYGVALAFVQAAWCRPEAARQ